MRLFLRAILLEIPRHLVILLTLVAIQSFDFNPLPAWTAVAVAYVLEFLITFFFAEWVFLRSIPRAKETVTVSVVFVVFGTAIEAAIYLWFTQGSWSTLVANYSWKSLYLVALYVLAVVFASYHVRRRKIQASLPEGLEG